MSCFSSPERRVAIDDILGWARTGLTWGQQVATVLPIPLYGPISQVLIALIDQIAVSALFEYHPHLSELTLRFLTLQAVRTNEQAAEAVLKDIQNLAEIIEGSKSGLETRIAPLSDADQRTVENEFQNSAAVRDRFDQFHEYVPTALTAPFDRDKY